MGLVWNAETITVGKVKADILVDEVVKGGDFDSGIYREVTYVVGEQDSDEFLNALLGFTMPSVPGGPITRQPPHQYPGNEVLYCMRAQARPCGIAIPAEKRLVDAHAWQVQARYEIPRLDIAGTDAANSLTGQAIPWSTQTVSGKSRIVMIPKGNLEPDPGSASTEVGGAFPLRVHLEEIHVTFFQVPFIYVNVYRALAKKVNALPIFDWAPGHVLFDQYTFTKSTSTDGTYTQTVDLVFLAQSELWNSWPGDDIAFVEVKGASSGDPPYAADDLSPLLQFAN